MQRIYLDHNATTPLNPLVAEAMFDAAKLCNANPASQHDSGQQVRRQLERLRESISERLGLTLSPPASEDQLLITSGGTESNNLVVFGRKDGEHQARFIASQLEHPSVTSALRAASASGSLVDWCRVKPNGVLDLDHFHELTSTPADCAFVMLANHETGVIQPIDEVGKRCREQNIPLHVDGTQWIGKQPFSFSESTIDSLTFAAHKFQGPIGIGGLVTRAGTQLNPILYGGFQQMAKRPGTESLFLLAGMEAALLTSLAVLDLKRSTYQRMRDHFEAILLEALPDLTIHGSTASRLQHVSNVGFPDVDGQQLFIAFDMAGVDCSTGSACASGSSERSPVLLAMGVPEELAGASFRFSFGCANQASDAEQAAKRIIRCFNNLRRRK